MQHRSPADHRAATVRDADSENAADTVALAVPTAARRSPSALRRRPGLYVGVAAAGAVLVNVLVGVEPAAQAEAQASESVAVAQALGLSAQSVPAQPEPDLEPLSDLAASRGTREAAEVAAAQAQQAADQAVLDRQRAEAEAAAAAAAAAARAAEEAAAAEAAAAAAAEASQGRPAPQPSGGGSSAAAAASTAASAIARISNSSGPVTSRVQAAANAVVSNVPGAGSITLGGTRPSATDPHGHPSGNALDYMVMSNSGLGDAITAYHIAHWDELGVEYLIWEQRILQSPGGSWSTMADRGGVTANHFDHVHVNYR